MVRLCFLIVAEVKGPCRLDKLFLLLLGYNTRQRVCLGSQIYGTVVGKARGQEHEAAGHTASAVRKQKV